MQDHDFPESEDASSGLAWLAELPGQLQLLESFSAFETSLRLDHLLSRRAEGAGPGAAEPDQDIAAVREQALALLGRAQPFVEMSRQAGRMVRTMSDAELEERFAALLSSGRFPATVSDRLGQWVQESGGIRLFLEAGAARIVGARDMVQRRFAQTDTSDIPDYPDSPPPPTGGPDDSALFTGGIGAMGVGAALILGAFGPAGAAAGAVGALVMVVAGGFVAGFGGAAVYDSLDGEP